MVSEKVRMVKDKIETCTSFLLLGLRFVSVDHRPSTNLLGESFVLNFSNEKMRSVQIIYYSETDNKDYFLINLVNDQSKDVFNIKDWLKKYDELDKESPFNLINYSGHFEEKIDSFVNYLENIFKKDGLVSILMGHTWESFAFDWAGMR